jgi:ribonucleoside-triphosphate reductase
VRLAHSRGDFHLHDLNLLAGLLRGWDLYDLLAVVFHRRGGQILQPPAKTFPHRLWGKWSISSTRLQGEAAGAQGFQQFRYPVAPFIRYDQLSFRGSSNKHAGIHLQHQRATRVGFQTPFTTLPWT